MREVLHHSSDKVSTVKIVTDNSVIVNTNNGINAKYFPPDAIDQTVRPMTEKLAKPNSKYNQDYALFGRMEI